MRMASSNRGFTLLELLISMSIAMTLILLSSELYQAVNRFGNQRLNTLRDFGAEQFVRNQYEFADSALNERLQAVIIRRDELSFISRRSAQWGLEQRPVLVTYKFNAATNTIAYTEQGLGAWWGRSEEVMRAELENLRYNTVSDSYKNTIFTNVEEFKMQFWDSVKRRWINEWSERKSIPPIARLTIKQLNETREIVLAGGVLSWSSVYGF